jgi:hypothetical protein
VRRVDMEKHQKMMDVWVAADGTEFSSEEECTKYERVRSPGVSVVSRFEAYEFALRQIRGEAPQIPNSLHHYGKCEIQQLLDYIYGVNSSGEEV